MIAKYILGRRPSSFSRVLKQTLACIVLLSFTSFADHPPAPVATSHLRIGAWNIENLGTRNSAPQQAGDLADYIASSHVDLLALEEIHDDDQKDPNDATQSKAPWSNAVLEEALPILRKITGDEWKYLLTKRGPSNKRGQLTGVLWRPSRLSLTGTLEIQVKGGTHNGNPELTYWTRQPEAFLFSAGAGKTDFAVIPLHLKSNTDQASVGNEMRIVEASQLKAVLNIPGGIPGKEADIILIGDTNINAPEQGVQAIWSDFIDLNEKDMVTYKNGNDAGSPFDRIFIPRGQPEFSASKQGVHGPYPSPGFTAKQWFANHNTLRSDHLLIWCDIKVADDDDPN